MRQLKITKQVTNREVASLDRYLVEVARGELISADDEVKLAQLIKQGDMAALERLVKANLRFVVSVSKQYQNQGLGLPDLINEGNRGLIKAAQRFDETRGFKFISYAVWWIRQAILQALAEQSRIVRLPLNKLGSVSKVNKAIAQLEQQYERDPTSKEVSVYLEISETEARESMRISAKVTSMDAPLIQDPDNTMYDVLHSEANMAPDSGLLYESLKKEVERSLSTLTPRQADVIRLYFGLTGNFPMTLLEIGKQFDIGEEGARLIKEKAIRCLKHVSRNKMLKTYLG